MSEGKKTITKKIKFENLPTINKVSRFYPEETCPICTEKFSEEPDKPIALLNCGHQFHEDELMQWYKNSNKCPTCKEVITRKKTIFVDTNVKTGKRKRTFATSDNQDYNTKKTNINLNTHLNLRETYRISNQLEVTLTSVAQLFYDHIYNYFDKDIPDYFNYCCRTPEMEKLFTIVATLRKVYPDNVTDKDICLSLIYCYYGLVLSEQGQGPDKEVVTYSIVKNNADNANHCLQIIKDISWQNDTEIFKQLRNYFLFGDYASTARGIKKQDILKINKKINKIKIDIEKLSKEIKQSTSSKKSKKSKGKLSKKTRKNKKVK